MASEERLQALFGPTAYGEGPLGPSGIGRRFHNLDLSKPLNADQAAFLLDALSHHGVISFPKQDIGGRFSLKHFERFANHFGAVVPHPLNYTGGETNGQLMPVEKRMFTRVNKAFPGQLKTLPGAEDSPAVFVVANLDGGGEGKEAKLSGGGSWHTDIEYEPLPLSCSMFLVQEVPTKRDQEGHSQEKVWVRNPMTGPKIYPKPSLDNAELMRVRDELPENGETAFTDTAAAFAALPKEEQAELEQVLLRRRHFKTDKGWLAPLVHQNPRTGVKSLHSPMWQSRSHIPPVELVGMTEEESRKFLDRLESHILQPQFRYNHVHQPGDVTIWNNLTTVHNSPPMKRRVGSLEDARVLYRISAKGPGSLVLPRKDDPRWIEENVVPPYVSPPEVINVVAQSGSE